MCNKFTKNERIGRAGGRAKASPNQMISFQTSSFHEPNDLHRKRGNACNVERVAVAERTPRDRAGLAVALHRTGHLLGGERLVLHEPHVLRVVIVEVPQEHDPLRGVRTLPHRLPEPEDAVDARRHAPAATAVQIVLYLLAFVEVEGARIQALR